MDPECKKSRVSKFIVPGIFLMGLLLLGFPSRQASADCGTEACAVCGDNVQCVNEELCSPGVEICEEINGVIVGSCPDTCDPDLSLEACLENPQTRISTCRFNDADATGDDRCECAECGNGNLVEEMEQCDDGNTVSGDGCSGCEQGTVDGVLCFGGCRIEECGDGVVQSGLGEECDDGNTNNNDGCSSTCKNERCGDGIENGDEDCDVGNGNADSCDTENGFQCVVPGEPGECTCKLCPQCGNGQIDPGEACDDGNNQSGDGCENDNNLENCGCENDCTVPVCGNGVVDTGFDANGVFHDEECDAAGSNDDHGLCTEDCQLAFCGDGHILNGPDQVITEVCDDGNNINGDGCSADCLTCPDIACGNGRLDGSDECEIGEEDECEEGETCNTDTCRCEEDQEPPPVCGNNDTESGEECDGTDDEACDDDGCNSNCECNDDECPGEDDNDDRNRACTAEEEAGHKATICHIPPGNPENAHTLCVGDPAVDAHMSNHGDTLGPCAEECPAAGLTTGDGGGGDGTGTSSSASGGCSLIR